jgi:hypothetical protein
MPTVRALVALLALLLAAAPRAAGEEPAPALEPAPVGYWEIRNTEGILMLLVGVDGTGDINRKAFAWTYHGGVLMLDREDKDPVSYDASFTADTLTLSGGNLRHPITLDRAPGGKKPDERIHGSWKADGGETIELRPDGIGTNRRGPFRFTADEGVLAYADRSIAFTGDYKIDGDRLELRTLGGTVTLHRAGADTATKARASRPAVVVNGRKLDARKLESLERDAKVRILQGSYWYDGVSGAWGLAGGPALGYVPAGLEVLGPLDSKAPSPRTGFFVNGRELDPKDVTELRALVEIPEGRYWVDAKGSIGFEGNPTPFLDLAGRAREALFTASGKWRDPASIVGVRRADPRESFVLGPFPRILLGD